ncbi:unnamed protein product [Owenia fusiformis]|uniref:Tetraspanin n=1 Tax=Owenia fusiformis TaxID=6347 RepID=A0A8J1UHF9_OWEFU|nr:unnamed protein product [Owenia fusiformis]
MGLGNCYNCIRYMVFIFNFAFWLLGCAVLAVGIWVCVDPKFNQYVTNAATFQSLFHGAYILIAVGLMMMLLGFLGCFGAVRESQVLLGAFFGGLCFIFLALVAVGIWGLVTKGSLRELVGDTLENAVENYHNNNTVAGKAARILMDNVQPNFLCCGAYKGLKDYKSLGSPSCKPPTYKKPCYIELMWYLNENIVIMAAVGITIGILMLLGMAFSMMLCCAIREGTAV